MVDQKKIAKTEELKEKFSSVKAAVLADFRGLNVQRMTDLRGRLRERSIEYLVVKNNLARRAAPETPFEAVGEMFNGPVSIAFSYDDQLAAAQIMTSFAKEEPALKITGGLLDGKAITSVEVEMLARLPSKEVLISKALAGMQSPLGGMVNVLSGVLRNLVYALKAIEDKKSRD